MAPQWYRAMAASVLSLHAAYIAWVIFGIFFTRGRPRLAALHLGTLVYGVIIEIWCPLTRLKHRLRCAITFQPIAALSFYTTSMRWCTQIFPRSFLSRALSRSVF
jgi:Protein of Unknown function (DUF2784)